MHYPAHTAKPTETTALYYTLLQWYTPYIVPHTIGTMCPANGNAYPANVHSWDMPPASPQQRHLLGGVEGSLPAMAVAYIHSAVPSPGHRLSAGT